ncbi:hypothetical protein QLX67_04145 [Balneolaceae bacterium ANBcel3]|nr:hypothetical protein [Balneolaceae bacterium ANBcel3]
MRLSLNDLSSRSEPVYFLMNKFRDVAYLALFMVPVCIIHVAAQVLFLNSVSAHTLLSSSFTTEVEVTSSLGHAVDNATVTITLKDGFGQQGTARQDEEYTLSHQYGGRYVNDRGFRGGSNETHISVTAPGHEAYQEMVSRSGSVPASISVRLYHNNYHERCNEDLGDGSVSWNPFRSSKWDDCLVDPDRLIETFGLHQQNFTNSGPGGDQRLNLWNLDLYKYTPEGDNHATSYGSRLIAFKQILEQWVHGVALSKATVQNRELTQWLEQRRDRLDQIDEAEFVVQATAFITRFDDQFAEFSSSLSYVGYGFRLAGAYEEGWLDAATMFLAYQSAFEEVLVRIEELAEQSDSWIKDDNAFHGAIYAMRAEYDENREKEIEQVARSVISLTVSETVQELIMGAVLKKAIAAGVGATLSSGAGVATGAAAPAVVVGVVAAGTAFVVYDYWGSVMETARQRALLVVAAQLDRYLLPGSPDYFNAPEVRRMSDEEQFDLMLRLQLGLLFNDVRAELYAGEYRTWIGNQFVYSEAGATSQAQAYELRKAAVSQNKREQAKEDIKNLLQFMMQDEMIVEKRSYSLDICDTWSVANSGGVEGTIDTWNIGMLPPGVKLDVRFNMYRIPDQLVMEYPPQNLVLDTGWRGHGGYDNNPNYPGGIQGSGQGQILNVFQKKDIDEFIIRVNGVDSGTKWEYRVRCRIP